MPDFVTTPEGVNYDYGEGLREALADNAHMSWSGWMLHLFGKSVPNEDGTVTIPREEVDRWVRQMRLPYDQLTEREKDSDRREADKILKVLGRSHVETICSAREG